jgi:hypothetical protein
VESFNGSGWSVTPSAEVSAFGIQLTSVWCGQTSCTAVGAGAPISSTGNPGAGGLDQSVVEVSSGTSWSLATVPDLGGLSAVSCLGPTWCVALGAFGGSLVESSF